jgi:hypothetical protein
MRAGRIVPRVRKLELHFEVAIETMRKVAEPSVSDLVVWRLAAGDWQSALLLLDGREHEAWKERYVMEQRTACPNDTIPALLTDLTRLRETLERSLAGLAPGLRYEIARRLMEADTNVAPLEGPRRNSCA